MNEAARTRVFGLKPHIWFDGNYWRCANSNTSTYSGATPMDAYYWWCRALVPIVPRLGF